ncbi:hypothetical protein AHF37_09668 [Paragonimus kellicotti]|nr:hypothetical protein AHF37_09668 [Paragonimus kellicotti]
MQAAAYIVRFQICFNPRNAICFRSIHFNLQQIHFRIGLFIVLLSTVIAQTRYWESILKHFEKEVVTDRFALRPHCGRNRYDGGYTKWSPQSVHKRIVGGEESRVAEWPWLVSLQLKASDAVSLNTLQLGCWSIWCIISYVTSHIVKMCATCTS